MLQSCRSPLIIVAFDVVLGLSDICSRQPFCEKERNVRRVDFESDGNRVMSELLCSAASDKAPSS